ncbi:MAG: RidA family protein, partial [Chloroflexi bacterium]|nr:RidA family protein [Chloroflexota bacterium]
MAIKTYTIPGVASTAPVPLAVQRGDLLFTSGVMGKEADGSLPADPSRQIELVFQHMITLTEMAGGNKDSIAHITVVLNDSVYRDQVNEVTIKHWPDADNRPARHSEQGSTPPDA